MDQVIRMMSDYKVEMINDGMQEFFVEFHGPKESKFLHPFACVIILHFTFYSVVQFLIRLLRLSFSLWPNFFSIEIEIEISSFTDCL